MTERNSSSPFASIEQAVTDLRAGKFVVVVDDEDRENEGDLVLAAEKATPEAINFMAREGRGLICLALTEERCDALELPPMVTENTSNFGTAFTVSIEARGRTTTGISAADRAATVLTAIDPATRPSDLNRPGPHVPAARAARRRPEARRPDRGLGGPGADRGTEPVGRALRDHERGRHDGARAGPREVLRSATASPMVTVADLIRYRMKTERLVERIASPHLPTRLGEFQLYAYRSDVTQEEHLALVHGEITEEEPVLVRVHSQCLTGDVFGSARCDCGEQLELAMEKIVEAGRGVFLYLLQEGRGIGLINKLKAYELQDQGHDTVSANEKLGFPPDIRNYGVGCQILRDLGVRKMRLMTNNPSKYVAIDGYGLEIVERVPLEVHPTDRSRKYLEAKKNKMGHLLKLV